MRWIPVAIGVPFTALAVWIGPHLVPYFGGQRYQPPDPIGQTIVSGFTLAPFVLTAWILGTRRKLGRPFARTALRIAAGAVAVGAAIPYLLAYYAAIVPKSGTRSIVLLSGFLILSSPAWVTVLGWAAFELTSRIALRGKRECFVGTLDTSSDALEPQAVATRRKWSRAIAPLSLLACSLFIVEPTGYRVDAVATMVFLVLSIVWGVLARQWVLVSIELGTIACMTGMAILIRMPHPDPPPESAAVANLRTINTAEVTYLSSSGGGRYGTMENLIAAQLLDDTFIGTKAGYNFSITLNATRSEYKAEAVPVSINAGRYGYYTLVDALIRYSTNSSLAPAGQTGKPIQ